MNQARGNVAIAAACAECCRGNGRPMGSRKPKNFLDGGNLMVFLIGRDKRRCGCKWPDPNSGWTGSNLLVVEKWPKRSLCVQRAELLAQGEVLED